VSHLSESLGSQELDEYMQDIEEMQDVDKDIKIPNEIGEEEYGQEEEGDSDMENEVFALAREN